MLTDMFWILYSIMRQVVFHVHSANCLHPEESQNRPPIVSIPHSAHRFSRVSVWCIGYLMRCLVVLNMHRGFSNKRLTGGSYSRNSSESEYFDRPISGLAKSEGTTMSEEKDRVTGTANEVKGRVKSAAGDLTGDNQTKAEGKLDELKGKLQQGLADAKEKADELVDRVTGDDKKK